MFLKGVFVGFVLLVGFMLWWYVGSFQPLANEVTQPTTIKNAKPDKVAIEQPTTEENLEITTTFLTQSELTQSDVFQTEVTPSSDSATSTIAEQVTDFVEQAQKMGAIPYNLAEVMLAQSEFDNYVDALEPVHDVDFKLRDELEQALFQHIADSPLQADLHRINCGGGFCMVMLSGDNEQHIEEMFRAAIKPQRIRAIFSRVNRKEGVAQLRIILSYSDAISGISVPAIVAK
ncbi:hypothetical protein [Alishewanella tabrizica]|uniref:Orphan protein n=1 Tax=Alishewanella tabrizica TaxID=671278 RepID=A0ABQ2WED6_9ALTE|nr:hypothetical protein [Alishewanella tabrizica]GGW51425.1 hypothetical protein GCM10008111_04240 [Alishewanella tabrizica]